VAEAYQVTKILSTEFESKTLCHIKFPAFQLEMQLKVKSRKS
jgi:hypothetical protein